MSIRLSKIDVDSDAFDQWGVNDIHSTHGMQGWTWQVNYVQGMYYLAVGV